MAHVPFRLFGLPLRGRVRPVRVDAGEVTRELQTLSRLPDDALLAPLDASVEGLTNHEAALRYRAWGPNSVANERHHGAWRQLGVILANPLSLLLVGLALVNWATGAREGALVIVAMVLAGGPGPLLDLIDRLVSEAWAVVSAWFSQLVR